MLFNLNIHSKKFLLLYCLIYLTTINTLFTQNPLIQANTDEETLIPITNKGIYIHKIEQGNGPSARAGDYIFSRFIISYKDSILNRSKPDAIDNVIFIPNDFDKHPNGALYEVFTYARVGDQLIFEMPFRMLPWKDPNLGDNDSIRYHIYIDSIKNESEYVQYYEQYLDDLQTKIDADNQAKTSIGDEVRTLADRHLKEKTSSPFTKNSRGQFIYKLKEGFEETTKITSGKVRFKYMALVLKDEAWDDTYFNTLVMEANIGSGEIPLNIEQVLKEMNPQDQWVIIIEEKNTDPSINQEFQTLCIWLELLN